MDTTTLAHAIRRRWLLIICVTLVGLGGAIVGVAVSTPEYESSVQLFVSAPETASDLQGAYQGGLFTQQRVVSYADIVSNPPVLAPVIHELHLKTTPAALGRRIRSEVPANTVLVNIFVTDPLPHRAQAIAALVGRSFVKFVQTLEQQADRGRTPIAVHVSRPASLPESPVKPQKKLLIAIGLVVGALAGVALAAILEALDTSVKELDDLGGGSDLVALGAIPFDAAARSEPVTALWHPGSRRAEALRQIRTNLQFISVDQPPRSVVVTSAVRGEGKSTTAAGVATVFGQAGARTVLVEGDLRLPSQSRYLDVRQTPGLSDLLLGRVTLQEALQEVEQEGASISVLPCGTIPPLPSELLMSERMRLLLRELEDQFDVVVIDAPPLLPVADASILGRVADGVILVVRERHTSRKEARRALEMLQTVDARVLGVVMSMVALNQSSTYYESYYAAPIGAAKS